MTARGTRTRLPRTEKTTDNLRDELLSSVLGEHLLDRDDVLLHDTLLNSVLGVSLEDLDVLLHETLTNPALGGNFEDLLRGTTRGMQQKTLGEILRHFHQLSSQLRHCGIEDQLPKLRPHLGAGGWCLPVVLPDVHRKVLRTSHGHP